MPREKKNEIEETHEEQQLTRTLFPRVRSVRATKVDDGGIEGKTTEQPEGRFEPNRIKENWLLGQTKWIFNGGKRGNLKSRNAERARPKGEKQWEWENIRIGG